MPLAMGALFPTPLIFQGSNTACPKPPQPDYSLALPCTPASQHLPKIGQCTWVAKTMEACLPLFERFSDTQRLLYAYGYMYNTPPPHPHIVPRFCICHHTVDPML